MMVNDIATEILLTSARGRTRVLMKLSGLASLVSFAQAGVALWAAVNYEEYAQSTAMFGLFGVYCVILLGLLIYTIFCLTKSSIGYDWAPEQMHTQRTWHKRAYKLLAGFTIFESCLFFGSIPILILHSMGFNLRHCLSGSPQMSFEYTFWKTVSSRGSYQRTQQLVNESARVQFSITQVGLFGTCIAALILLLLSLGVYWYSESVRVGTRPSVWYSKLKFREWCLLAGFASVVVQLICGIVGMASLGNMWFGLVVAFALGSTYYFRTLWMRLKSDSPSRIQLRRISHSCYSLMLLGLYSSGIGAVLACTTDVPIYSSTGVLILKQKVITQLVAMVGLHLVFNALVGISTYMHMSVTDKLESVLVASGDFSFGKRTEDEKVEPVVVDDHIQQDTHFAPITCISCHLRVANVSYIPCGHSVTCRECTEFLTTVPDFRCPTCEGNVFDYMVRDVNTF